MTIPLKVMEEFMNKKVLILLKDNRLLDGKLIGFDEYMNMILENTEETTSELVRNLGIVIVRGNNVVRISSK